MAQTFSQVNGNFVFVLPKLLVLYCIRFCVLASLEIPTDRHKMTKRSGLKQEVAIFMAQKFSQVNGNFVLPKLWSVLDLES